MDKGGTLWRLDSYDAIKSLADEYNLNCEKIKLNVKMALVV